MQENIEQPLPPFEPVACGHMADGGCCLRCANEQRKAHQLAMAASLATSAALVDFATKLEPGADMPDPNAFALGLGYGVGFMVRKLGAAGISSVAILNAIEAPDAN